MSAKPNWNAKHTVLAAMRRQPDLSRLASLPALPCKEGRELMRWLDQGGLALYLLARLDSEKSIDRLPNGWNEALHQRRERNRARLTDMLVEFEKLNRAFCASDIAIVTLKGFSLIPDFCEDPVTRHQTDFDFLANSKDVKQIAEMLSAFGYSTPRLSLSEESCFTTPLLHIPSHKDDLYALQHHRQVDLHVSLSESSPWIELELPTDSIKYATALNVCGVTFQGLSLADRFLAQVFHAFRHSFRSWLRISWLFEIGYFMELHRKNDPLWGRIIERSGNSQLTKRIFYIVLGTTNRLFHSRVPASLESWISEGMTPTLAAWLEQFSVDWAVPRLARKPQQYIHGFRVHSERKLRKKYFASRLIPKRGQTFPLRQVGSENKLQSIAWNIERWRYLANVLAPT